MISPYGREVRMMLRAALLLFTFTVVIGILNGTDLVDFDRKTLLAHVHAGTLGWITMSVLAGSFWLFALGDSRPSGTGVVTLLAIATPIAMAAYAGGFLLTYGVLRPIIGGTVLLCILGAYLWVLRQTPGRTMSVPHVGMLAALTMSLVGAVLGVLLGYRIANGSNVVPETAAEAHPAAMVVGFLVPVGMAFIEWVLDPNSVTKKATLAGWLQIGLPFLGGLLAMIGLLLEITPLVTFGVPFEIIGLVILVVRMRGPLMAVRVTGDSPARHGLAGLIFLIVNISLLVYLVGKYFSKEIDPPTNVLLALDHSIFIGVMTNSILAIIVLFRRPVAAMVDHLVFAGLNLGLAGFVVGLLADSAPVKRVATPVMGLAILLALAISAPALGATDES